MYNKLSDQDKEICQRLINLDKAQRMLVGLLAAMKEGLEIDQAEYELGRDETHGEITEYSLLIINNAFMITAYKDGTETRSIITPKGRKQ